MKTLFKITTLLIFIILTGCAPKQAMIKNDLFIADGKYKEAADFSQKQIDQDDPYARNNLLWQIQTGYNYFLADDINSSTIKYFNNSETLMKHYREQRLAKDISQTLSSALLNDTTRPYIGNEYDGVMINTYKAIEYMQKGDTNAARVEFNRAIDRQRRAKIFFNEMIKKEQDAIAKEEIKNRKKGRNVKVEDSKIDSILKQKYSSLHQFEAYPDFINPMTTYLAGLFAKANKNNSKAESLLKEAYGMMPENEDVKDDLSSQDHKPTVWLIFENGQAPYLEEWRLDFPLWIFTDKVSYISVALPKIRERELAYSHLNIVTNDKKNIETHYLCSMENIIKTEFAKKYPSIVRRSILAAATKAGINYALQESASNSGSTTTALISIAAGIYQIASTQADTRIWSTLPKEFQLAKFSKPKDNIVTVKTPNNIPIKSINLPAGDNILIYVKIAKPNTKASVLVIPF